MPNANRRMLARPAAMHANDGLPPDRSACGINGQIEQRRPAGLVGRRPGPDRRSSRPQDRPATAVELAAALGTAKSGSLIVAAIASVFTIGYVANLLREDEDWLHELSIDMFPEDGRLWVYGVGGAKKLLSGSLSSPFPRPRQQLTARRAQGDRERWFRAMIWVRFGNRSSRAAQS